MDTWKQDTMEGNSVWADGLVCQCTGFEREQNRANAAHIVRCVNAHDDLLAALAAIVKEIGPQFGINDDDTGTLHTVARIARAAIAKVEA